MAEQYEIVRWSEPFLPHPARLADMLAADGYEINQWCDLPGVFYGMQKNTEYYSRWVVSGMLEIRLLHGGVYRIGPGDRDFLPPDVFHSLRAVGDVPTLYFVGIKSPAIEPASKPAAKRSRPKKASKTKADSSKAKPATKRRKRE
ncbi:MAG: hypothetical protein ABI539_00590 [Acidobacteriota bacterium]